MEIEKNRNSTSSGIPISLPLVQQFSDYRRFLRDFYEAKKSQRSGFSFRRFSSLCGFKSPNYLQLVMNGERNLSEEMARKVADVVGLKTFEKRYFLSLVREENARSDEELRQATKEKLSALRKISTRQVPNAQRKVFESWYHLLVRELVLFRDFEATGEYISRKLQGAISEQEAEASWTLLKESGFVARSTEGHWILKDVVLDSGDGAFQKMVINKHHADNLQNWRRLLEDRTSGDDELGLINIPIAKAKIPELKQRVRQFQDEIIGWLQDEKQVDSLVQLGTYVFLVGK